MIFGGVFVGVFRFSGSRPTDQPGRDAGRGDVDMVRYREVRRRRIIRVDTIASLNQAADICETAGIIVFGPLSFLAAHGGRSCRKPFRKFWPNHRAWGPAQRQTASPNALKIRTRRRGVCPRLWCNFRDFTSPRPPGTRGAVGNGCFQISSLTTVSSGRLKSSKSRQTRRRTPRRRVRVFGIFDEALGVVRAAYTPSGG